MGQPWIPVIPEEEAEGRLQEGYRTVRDRIGRLGKMMQIHSLNPDVVVGQLEQFMAVMFSRTDLGRVEREVIAVVVSAENGCRYWLRQHGAVLRKLLRDRADAVDQLEVDYREADLTERERLMCRHAVKLTLAPKTVTAGDLEDLRKAGFSDQAILHLTEVVAFFNWTNRVALGLGMEDWVDWDLTQRMTFEISR